MPGPAGTRGAVQTRSFRLGDAEFGALAAGRPSAETLGVLRRAQLSRHLLMLSALPEIPSWYAPARLDDPLVMLRTAAARAGRPVPGPPRVSPHLLTSTHAGLTLRVRLEDTDPMRAGLGLPPTGPLTAAAVDSWRRHLDEAWRILATRHPAAAATLARVLSVIVPVEPDPGAGGISATSADAFGAVAISPPADPTALAVGLLHEAQHSVLNAVRTLFDLTHPTTARGYSPWRDDPRPPFGILHGAYAYLAVTRFWRAEIRAGHGGALPTFEFARWRTAVVTAADTLLPGDALDRGVLTPAGRRLVAALRDEAAGWLAEPVDPEVERLAAGANVDHRVRWRLRNLEVGPADAAALADAWRRGEPPPAVVPRLRPAAGRELERNERLDRVHARLRELDGVQRGETGAAGGRVRPGGDAWLGAGHGTGPDAYILMLQESATDGPRPSPREITALSGLALLSPLEAFRASPEVVFALHRTIRATPFAIASYLTPRT